MGRTIRGVLAVMFLSVAVAACGGGEAPAPDRPVNQASAVAQLPPSEPAAKPAAEPAHEPTPAATTAQVATPPESPKPAAPVAKVAAQDPGGPIEVASTVEGVTRIGAEKCKMCHKLQFTSWSESGHGKRDPSLDCEGCHGPGSGYKTLAVMKDPAKALAAGLVTPEKAFCAQCHKSDWTDAMMAAVHAHKPK